MDDDRCRSSAIDSIEVIARSIAIEKNSRDDPAPLVDVASTTRIAPVTITEEHPQDRRHA